MQAGHAVESREDRLVGLARPGRGPDLVRPEMIIGNEKAKVTSLWERDQM